MCCLPHALSPACLPPILQSKHSHPPLMGGSASAASTLRACHTHLQSLHTPKGPRTCAHQILSDTHIARDTHNSTLHTYQPLPQCPSQHALPETGIMPLHHTYSLSGMHNACNTHHSTKYAHCPIALPSLAHATHAMHKHTQPSRMASRTRKSAYTGYTMFGNCPTCSIQTHAKQYTSHCMRLKAHADTCTNCTQACLTTTQCTRSCMQKSIQAM